MPYTVSQVLGSDPDSLLAASLNARAAGQRVNSQITTAKKQFFDLRADWTGVASDAAQKQGREMLGDQEEYRDKLYAIATPLAMGGKQLTELRTYLKRTVDEFEGYWDVADDGSVTPGFWLRWYASISHFQELEIEAKRIGIECDIKLLLAQFEAVDKDTAYKLRKIGWNLA